MAQEADEEQPLDPELELVRKRMLRLLVVSIGIMGIGLFAVLGAIVYKLSGGTVGSSNAVAEYSLGLSENNKISNSHVDQGRLVLEVNDPQNGHSFIIVDLETGRIISRISER